MSGWCSRCYADEHDHCDCPPESIWAVLPVIIGLAAMAAFVLSVIAESFQGATP